MLAAGTGSPSPPRGAVVVIGCGEGVGEDWAELDCAYEKTRTNITRCARGRRRAVDEGNRAGVKFLF